MSRRLVTSLPMTVLWNETGPVSARRTHRLSAGDIEPMLTEGAVQFVFADIGQPLTWVPPRQAPTFYKSEIAPHLIEPPLSQPDGVPGGYGYTATLWETGDTPIVVLEMHRSEPVSME